jgi:hypothetical protein
VILFSANRIEVFTTVNVKVKVFWDVTLLTLTVDRNISEETIASIFTVMESSGKLQFIAGKKTTIFSFVCRVCIFYSDAFFDFDMYLCIIIHSSKV